MRGWINTKGKGEKEIKVSEKEREGGVCRGRNKRSEAGRGGEGR